MHFATPRQLAAIALAWALFLIAFDQHANPRPIATILAEVKGGSTRPTIVAAEDTPRIRLSMPHLCCTGCLNDVRAALKGLTWLGPARLAAEPPPIEEVGATTADTSNAHEVEFAILDLGRVDVVLIEQALRETGLVPDRIEVFGMGHFRLEVELPHLCCTLCSKAVDQQLDRFLRKENQGRWYDSMSLDHIAKRVVVYPRYNAVVDVEELDRALAQSGFSARSIRVLTSPEE